MAYALVLRLATPLYLWRVWSRGRQEPGYRHHWWERLGIYGPAYQARWLPHRQPVVWVHAVSLGEARAASALIEALREQVPGMRLLLTHSTSTGREAGRALLNLDTTNGRCADEQTWLPYDTPGAVRRFLRQHQPAVGVLIETEVWPCMQHEAQRAGVPMVLANARLSDKSLRQGLRLACLMRPALRSMAAVLAQTPADAQRLLLLKHGRPDVPDAAVTVCGNVKFDMTPAPDALARGQSWGRAVQTQLAAKTAEPHTMPPTMPRPIVLAASTREGEEAPLLAAWQQQCVAPSQPESAPEGPLHDAAPLPRLLIVPRHPQRFDEVAALIEAHGWRLSRRSAWPQGQPDADALAADVWLGDSMGEMPAYFAAARVALLGGSFAPLGGQNLIEAAACGCPIIMGPSTFNFEQAAELSEQAGAAQRVSHWAQGVAMAWVQCRASPSEHALHVQKCMAFAKAHRGAAKRMAGRIHDCMLASRVKKGQAPY